MKTNNKGFDYCFNAQVVVDEEHQIILTAEPSAAANDKQQAIPMAEATVANLEAADIERPQEESRSESLADATPTNVQVAETQQPQAEVQSEASADATVTSLQAAGIEQPQAEGQAAGAVKRIPLSADNGYFSEDNVGGLETRGFDPHIATGRQKHNQPQASEGVASPPAKATVKERMAQKLRTPEGRACYAKRKQIVEPVFRQIKQGRGFRQFLLRGLSKVQGEWNLVCLTHNLLKIWRYQYALN
jgi:hypothetical protein